MAKTPLALALALAVGAATAFAAAAGTPLPKRPQGGGKEQTRGGGTISGTAFQARSAFAFRDGYGDVSLFLMPRLTSCHAVSSQDVPYVWVHLITAGKPLPVGKPVTPSGRGRVLATFANRTGSVRVTSGVSLVFTRIDTSGRGIWRGRIKVASRKVAGLRLGYSGTFAARWCGSR